MKTAVIKISPDGKTAVSLYSDTHPLDGIGRKSLVRASNVLFDEQSQKWYMHEETVDGGDFRHDPGFVKREDAIQFEIAVLERRLEHNPEQVDAFLAATTVTGRTRSFPEIQNIPILEKEPIQEKKAQYKTAELGVFPDVQITEDETDVGLD